MKTTRIRRLVALAAVAALPLAGVACSEDGDPADVELDEGDDDVTDVDDVAPDGEELPDGEDLPDGDGLPEDEGDISDDLEG